MKQQSGKKIALGLLGGTGYGAAELLKFLTQHPEIDVVSVVSSSQAGELLNEYHRGLKGFYEGLRFSESLDPAAFEGYPEKLIIAALPHGKSAEAIFQITQQAEFKQFKLIDLSGDFRLQNTEAVAAHYPDSLKVGELKAKFVYGLTEKNREQIKKARYIANPGCLASAAALALLPLMEPAFKARIVIDAKTGSSGAGRGLQESFHHPFRHSNLNAYKILEHRHEPEIREALGDVGHQRLNTMFVPHVLPISRGILLTAYLQLPNKSSLSELQERYQSFYSSSPFVRLRSQAVDLNDVVGSNFCDISLHLRGPDLVVCSSLDNLVKGMAGQAIQNINLLCGLEETLGIWSPPLGLA